jgi:hypothetical protein
MEQRQPQHFEPGDRQQGDLLMLAALRRDGFDIEAPADVACFLDMGELDAARAAARELRVLGWQTTVGIAPDERSWTVRGERRMVPAYRRIEEMGQTLEAVALRWGGAYDGWGVRAHGCRPVAD